MTRRGDLGVATAARLRRRAAPDRMLLGSEGTLGVVTEAWVRVQSRPAHRAGAACCSPTSSRVRRRCARSCQAGLHPAGCRLLDGTEARLTGTNPGGEAVLVLAFESPDHPVERGAGGRALAICGAAGGRALPARTGGATSGQWRDTFLRAPFLRDQLVLLGVLSETFETAVTWDRFDELVSAVTEATRDGGDASRGGGHRDLPR